MKLPTPKFLAKEDAKVQNSEEIDENGALKVTKELGLNKVMMLFTRKKAQKCRCELSFLFLKSLTSFLMMQKVFV